MAKKKISISWLGFLLLIPSLLLNLYFLNQKRTDQQILVLAVLDGDTLVLEGKTRLRLRHIDAPELKHCGGPEAKEVLENLVKDKKIIIQEKILDQKGRAMALVYQNNQLVNLEMIRSGWVRYHSDQSSAADELKQVASQAKEAKKGIFSTRCYQTEPEDSDCIIKGNLDKNSGRRLYYLPNCVQYKFTIIEKDLGEDWFCTEKQAQEAGYVKSKTCY